MLVSAKSKGNDNVLSSRWKYGSWIRRNRIGIFGIGTKISNRIGTATVEWFSFLAWKPLDAVQQLLWLARHLLVRVMHTTSRKNWISYSPSNGGTLSGPSFFGISLDHRVKKLVQHQHHPRAELLAANPIIDFPALRLAPDLSPSLSFTRKADDI